MEISKVLTCPKNVFYLSALSCSNKKTPASSTFFFKDGLLVTIYMITGFGLDKGQLPYGPSGQVNYYTEPAKERSISQSPEKVPV